MAPQGAMPHSGKGTGGFTFDAAAPEPDASIPVQNVTTTPIPAPRCLSPPLPFLNSLPSNSETTTIGQANEPVPGGGHERLMVIIPSSSEKKGPGSFTFPPSPICSPTPPTPFYSPHPPFPNRFPSRLSPQVQQSEPHFRSAPAQCQHSQERVGFRQYTRHLSHSKRPGVLLPRQNGFRRACSHRGGNSFVCPQRRHPNCICHIPSKVPPSVPHPLPTWHSSLLSHGWLSPIPPRPPQTGKEGLVFGAHGSRNLHGTSSQNPTPENDLPTLWITLRGHLIIASIRVAAGVTHFALPSNCSEGLEKRKFGWGAGEWQAGERRVNIEGGVQARGPKCIARGTEKRYKWGYSVCGW